MLTRYERPPDAVPVRFDGASFISERRNFAYACIPKTMSRSMLAYLKMVDPDGYRAIHRRQGTEALTAVPDATRFTFVRNPYSRLVAVYYDKFVNFEGAPGQRALFASNQGLRPDMTLTELAEWLVTDRGNDRRVDAHLASQHCFLLARDGTPAVDYVGRVEDSDADVGALQGLLGLEPVRIPRDNTNARRKRVRFDTTNRWREVLDDRTIGLLTARYESDFELLGYPRSSYKVIPFSFPDGPAAAATPTPRTLRWRVANLPKRVLRRTRAVLGSRT